MHSTWLTKLILGSIAVQAHYYIDVTIEDTGKHAAELGFWREHLGERGNGPRTVYYRRFMLNMGGLDDAAFFDGLVCLDIGCGPMGSLTWLPRARLALGLDPLAEAYREFEIDRHAMRYLPARAEAMPLATGSVDAVFSMNSLDHVDDFPAACREIRRVLRRGGYFIGSLNLDEPPTACEPWTLTEPILAEHLFAGWERQFYQTRPKMDDGDPYRLFLQPCPPEFDGWTGPRALWCRFRVT